MSEVLAFNQSNMEMRFLSPHDHAKLSSLKEEGWLINPTLVHMHNPQMNQDITIPVGLRRKWEEKGFYAEPTMIYHPKDGTKKVSSEDAKRAFKNGWYASPAMFPGNDIGALKTLVMKEAS